MIFMKMLQNDTEEPTETKHGDEVEPTEARRKPETQNVTGNNA